MELACAILLMSDAIAWGYRGNSSITAHIVGRKNTAQTNVKAVKVSKTFYQQKAGKSAQIKAVSKGTCDIYVYARNGYAKKIKVTVK